MNFIFDIGNVLINFRPKEFLHALHPEQSDANKMYEVIFQSSEWVQLDRGVISQEDATNLFCIREPEYKQLIIATMSRLEEMLTLITGNGRTVNRNKSAWTQAILSFKLSQKTQRLRSGTILVF